MREILLGTFPNGAPHYLYQAEVGPDGVEETLVRTGPIVAVLTVSDGTAYDVTKPYVAVPDEHVRELTHLLGDHYRANNHPDHKGEGEFVHEREATDAALDVWESDRKALKAAAAKSAAKASKPAPARKTTARNTEKG